ncbi:fam-a protein [Plasmodium vinckei petteri]|uniref:Fam-a protein n=1 Tax=Plasmodium vinckei petteri TaxID=138298 RepID=A0A6V7TBI7_PLAVN|nr:fam-a protein [Plasmodium vinckei petteri]
MNKFYIQIVFFLLSIFICVNNITLATVPTPKKKDNKTIATVPTPKKKDNKTLATAPDIGIARNIKPKKCWDTPKEIYEKNKDLLCTNPNEIAIAVKLMNEAARHLEHHATCKDGYKPRRWNWELNNVLFKKKHGNTVVQKMNVKYYHVHTYNEITNILWDPALANKFNNGSVKRKIVRVYNPNLVMIEQSYKSWFGIRQKYFYALAAKFDISEEKTIIVMTSPNINDRNSKNKKQYLNPIIENANVFKTQINSEHDNRNGIWKKTFVNIAGYLLEKTSAYINITYLESIDGHTSKYKDLINVRNLNNFFHYHKKWLM